MERPSDSVEHTALNQQRIKNIYERYSKFPPMGVEEDEAGQMVATFSYPDQKENPDRIEWISGKKYLDGRINIYYAKGKYVGQINLRKNLDTEDVELLRSVVYQRDLHLDEKRAHSMIPTITKKGISFKPDLRAIENLLSTIEEKMIEDPNFFKDKITPEQRDKVMRWNRAMIKARVTKTEQLRKDRDKKEKSRIIARVSSNGSRRKLS